MHEVTSEFLAALFAHSALHLLNVLKYNGVSAQSPPPPLITQFSAAAVSCRASCNLLSPLMLMQIASVDDSALLTSVSVMTSPHTFRHPPAASITACAMFLLFFLLVPACVPQNPGVLQIAVCSGMHTELHPSPSVWLPSS